MFGGSGTGRAVDSRLFGGSQGFSPGFDRRLSGFQEDPDNIFARQQAEAFQKFIAENPPETGGATGGGVSGGISSPNTGGWQGINQWDSQVQRAAAATGVPANVIKSIMRIESQGNPNALSSQGYYGLMQTGPDSAVPDYMKSRQWLSDPYNQVLAGATELMNKYNATGRRSWEAAAGAYLGYGVDANGTSTNQYQQWFTQYLNELNSSGGGSNSAKPGTSGLFSGAGTQLGGSLAGNSVVQIAESYVGKVPYVWGGIPGKGQSPYGAGGGWDCSGMTYWLDQNYGSGQLPMGSHYQYQYAQRTGQLFTNLSQLQPGDLIFINTGWQGGAGGDLNAAGHVAMYAGNGKIVHAANENEGTIISDLSRYSNILGAMHMSWSGGAGAGYQQAGQQFQQQTYGGNWFDQPLSVLFARR